MGPWQWLTHVEVTQPNSTNIQTVDTYNQSFAYKEAQKNLIFTLLLTAALVMVISKTPMMVRGGAVIAIALVLYAGAGLWSQRLTDKKLDVLISSSWTNLDKVRHALLALVALLGLGLLGRVLWTGCL